jgi:hypothetical protein
MDRGACLKLGGGGGGGGEDSTGAIPHVQAGFYPVIFYYPWPGPLFHGTCKKVARVHLGTLQLNGLTMHLRGCSLADSVINPLCGSSEQSPIKVVWH